jgi:hypothetical protein
MARRTPPCSVQGLGVGNNGPHPTAGGALGGDNGMVTRSVLMVNDPFLVVSGESLGDVRRESSTRALGNGRGRGRRSPRAGGSVSPPLLEELGGSRDGSLPVVPSVPEVVSGIGTVLISSAVQAPVNDVGGATIIPPVSIRPPWPLLLVPRHNRRFLCARIGSARHV